MHNLFTKENLIYIVPSLLVLCITYALSFHALIVFDYSIVIDRSYRIFLGQIPYRDYFIPTTPLSFMIQAAIFKIFSPSVFWMKAYLSVMNALLMFMPIYLCKEILKIDMKLLLFVVIPLTIVWSPGTIIMKPWYDFDGNIFAFLSLLLLVIAAHSNRKWFFLAAGISSALCVLCKQTIGAGSTIMGFVFILIQPGSLKDKIKNCFLFMTGLAIPTAVFLGYLFHYNAWRQAYDWIFVRPATLKLMYGSNFFLQALQVIFHLINNFVKLAFVLYIAGIIFSWKERKENPAEGSLKLGIVLYSLFTMWFSCLAEGGNDYPQYQMYLGTLCGILLTHTARRDSSVRFASLIKKPSSFLILCASLMAFIWPVYKYWAIPLKFNVIKYSPSQERVKGLYFHYSDYRAVQELLDFEKGIPKTETVFIWPDPVFFYFATGRIPPTPHSCFNPPSLDNPFDAVETIGDDLAKNNVQWAFIGKETFFDYGPLRFGMSENWETAVKKGLAMGTRVSGFGGYFKLRDYLYENFVEVTGPASFWTLKRKTKKTK